jgi:hypothetical protein
MPVILNFRPSAIVNPSREKISEISFRTMEIGWREATETLYPEEKDQKFWMMNLLLVSEVFGIAHTLKRQHFLDRLITVRCLSLLP